jgi:hypothetical protein
MARFRDLCGTCKLGSLAQHKRSLTTSLRIFTNDFASHVPALASFGRKPESTNRFSGILRWLVPLAVVQMGSLRCCRRIVRTIGSENNSLRAFATEARLRRQPQTFIEKVVQQYAVGWPKDKAVKAGDYVMIRPEHVMSHDNTGPVISK